MERSVESGNSMDILAIVILTLIAIYKNNEQEIDNTIIFIESGVWIYYLLLASVLIVLIYLTFNLIKRNKVKTKQRKQHLESVEEELNIKLNKSFRYYDYKNIQKATSQTKEYLDRVPQELIIKYQNQINIFYNRAENMIKIIKSKQIKKIKEEKQKEIQQQGKNEKLRTQIQELYNFKKSKNSIIALPLNNKYSNVVISEATRNMREYLAEQNIIKNIKKEAILYYKENILDTKPDLCDWHETIYADIRKEIQEGKISVTKNKTIDNTGEKLKSNFYRARGLDIEIKNRALAQGFKHIRGNRLDGHFCGGGYYIKKSATQKETDYHFYMKYLFAELQPNMKIEYVIKGKRADVAYISNKLRLAIEIETGTNKIEQLAVKIPWLNDNFDKWIFVCSRKVVDKYSKYVDNKKSFCLTPKRAKEKVLGLTYGSPIKDR